jgi:hypothetical protein
MPLTQNERTWLENAEAKANDPAVQGEGLSIRIVVYLLRQIVTLREDVADLKTRVSNLEP